MKHIRLAPAGNEEKGYFWRLYQQAMRGHIETLWGWDDNWQRQDFAKRWQNNDNLLLVSGRLNLGYAQVSRGSARELSITMLIIAPQWRNKGIGRKVLLSLLQAYQARQLELRVFRCNQQALQFYVSAGFRISGEDPEFYSLQGRAEELQAAQPAARRA